MLSCSVVSNSLRFHGLYPTRLLCPWDFPGKNTGVGCYFLLQGIFPTQGSNPCLLHLLHWQVDTLPLSHLGSPTITPWFIKLEEMFQITCSSRQEALVELPRTLGYCWGPAPVDPENSKGRRHRRSGNNCLIKR